MYKTVFKIDPNLAAQAQDEINSMGVDKFVLEGATDLLNGRYRLWYRHYLCSTLFQRDIPIKLTDRKTEPVSEIVTKIIIPPKELPSQLPMRIQLPKVISKNAQFFEFTK